MTLQRSIYTDKVFPFVCFPIRPTAHQSVVAANYHRILFNQELIKIANAIQFLPEVVHHFLGKGSPLLPGFVCRKILDFGHRLSCKVFQNGFDRKVGKGTK